MRRAWRTWIGVAELARDAATCVLDAIVDALTRADDQHDIPMEGDDMATRSSTWTCPVCGEQIEVEFDVDTDRARKLCDPITVNVTTADTALADVFAHGWTHGQDTE